MYEKLEKKIGNLKFAVIIISLFCIFMIVGTFLESYYGTDFANRIIYKRWPFMLIQFSMFLSIYFAAMLRLPLKKRLYGFYTIHTGLILIGIGSFVTYYAGVDGSITLAPSEPNRTIVLSDDIVKITFPEEGLQVSSSLPFNAFETNIDTEYREIKLKRYLPYAQKKLDWISSQADSDIYHSSQYQIGNENISQEFTLTLHPKAIHFKPTLTLGLLNISYLASPMAKCFGDNNPSKLIIWNQELKTCFSPESQSVSIQKTKEGSRFFVVEYKGQLFSFFPDHSPWPMDDKLKVVKDSPLRVFSKKVFEDKPNLFAFGEKVSYFDKDNQKWVLSSIPTQGYVDLPWMGFKLKLLRHESKKYPVNIPEYTLPIQKNGVLIKGDLKALEVEVRGQKYWTTDQRPLALMIDGKRVDIQLTKDTLKLPFEFVLKKFKMDTNPGTMTPASYESFVTLFKDDGPEDHHIYMNNPLKYLGFTFYQASYGKTPQGYVSTLSANVDQGRPIKYFGSILLVLGSLFHHLLNKSKFKKNKQITNNNSNKDSKHEMV